MNYSQLIKAVNSASAFDLYRLSCAIENEMTRPDKIYEIKSKLIIGQTISYFDRVENKLKLCTVEKLAKSNIHVIDNETNYKMSLPYFMINIDSSDIEIEISNRQKLSKNEIKVGEIVYFTYQGIEHHGMIIRLNTKTVTLITSKSQRWRVGYNSLSKVIEGQVAKEYQSVEFNAFLKEQFKIGSAK
jgi:hypothetical protein